MKLQPENFPDAARCAEYRRQGYWGDATLLDYWDMAVRAQPDKTAVVDNSGARLSYTELDKKAGRIAGWLRKTGINAGDVVCLQLPGCVEFTLLYVACLKAGAVVNPIIAAYRGRELGHIIRMCKPKVLFMPHEFRHFNYIPLAESLLRDFEGQFTIVHVERGTLAEGVCTLSAILSENDGSFQGSAASADDIAAVLFTSGTESLPKGALLTHNNIISSIRSFAARLNLNSRDVMFMPSPVGHATGFHHGVTTPFILGGTSVLQDIFDPDQALQIIARERCTYGMGAASFVYDLSCAMGRHKHDISSLRFFICGGAASPRHMLEDLWQKGFRVINCYGSTESVPHTVSAAHQPRNLIFMTDGSPVAGCEIRIVDKKRNSLPPGVEGEEASRGPNVFVGYLGDPGHTDAVLDGEGWYYSGDLGIMDENGHVRIIGRKKDTIVRGGENISSRELEEILEKHPLIAETAVVGMPDPRLGERSCAYVVLKGSVSFEEIIRHFSESCVAKYKYPERMEIVDALPRNPVGKVLKHELRRDIAEKLKKEEAAQA